MLDARLNHARLNHLALNQVGAGDPAKGRSDAVSGSSATVSLGNIVTAVRVELASTGSPANARVTANRVEIASAGAPSNARVTKQYVEVATRLPTPPAASMAVTSSKGVATLATLAVGQSDAIAAAQAIVSGGSPLLRGRSDAVTGGQALAAANVVAIGSSGAIASSQARASGGNPYLLATSDAICGSFCRPERGGTNIECLLADGGATSPPESAVEQMVSFTW